jgi:predicted CoA-substrate-specific enzyme activase
LVPSDRDGAPRRFLGLDVGAETIKICELFRENGELRSARQVWREHGKRPGPVLLELLRELDWESADGAAVCGRLSRQVALPHVPVKQAQATGHRFRFGDEPATLVSIGSHGFSVLELRPGDVGVFRENSRCSQGTGNFLRQLVERFSLGIDEASELCADVAQAIPLSGRCPVILKTDMTHLANKGEDRARILAGLFDAVCENVLVLVKPGASPSRVLLLGGVSRSRRVRRHFQTALERGGMSFVPLEGEEALFFEATGCAVTAASASLAPLPALDEILQPSPEARLERVGALSACLHQVRRMPVPTPPETDGQPHDLILGFDIGSTGSKLVALEPQTAAVLWEGYLRTRGSPVGAAQELLREFVQKNEGRHRVLAAGVTGSGREIVGSLMTTCYGPDAVFVLNEIAAHAEGALHYDPQVDTIFEIGGQDAKYIRLSGGRVIDCAMNEACSAGTGSFIEEQGQKFSGIRDVSQLGREALRARHGISLGQHCSVFMAEIIDEAVAAGEERGAILAGLHDSIIQNYLHRVKGNRSVGQLIFCQGMPFASDALAAAVARQTGSGVVIPPNPGTVGALGIALLARKELAWRDGAPLDPDRFLEARVEGKDTFVCKSTVGCGGAGNHCRIDSLRTVVAEQRQRFVWGGSCALYDKGTRKRKLPDLSPNPFRERDEMVQALKENLGAKRNRARVAISDEFMLKGLFPFFATFLHELGFDLVFPTTADQTMLKRGIQRSNVPFCAPMQLFHGVVGALADSEGDFLFVPMLRSLPRAGDEANAVTCPIVQASPHILRGDLKEASGRLISPVIDIGSGDLESPEFLASCERTAAALGLHDDRWRGAHRLALSVQQGFERSCREIGLRALEFCQHQGVIPVVVLGRPYTLYNNVLNSNVPAILREQGALAVPVDCYPLESTTPLFHDLYWGYAHRILRVAHQIRRAPGVYSLYCSNYSCGPDSFNLHFYGYIMEGRPFAIIETDGHAGDAGTKTRVEAFLYCVEQDRRRADERTVPNDFSRIRNAPVGLGEMRHQRERVVIPLLGPSPKALAACLRGVGIAAECLPPADAEAVRWGRRHTSGKECLPMTLTLGGLLQRLHQEEDKDARFVFLMPATCGPCRLGVYSLLDRVVLERLGLAGRVRVWSPTDNNYFDGLPPGFSALVFAGFMACDLLEGALLDVRPGAEARAVEAVFDRFMSELLRLLEEQAQAGLSVRRTLWEVTTGRLFGVRGLLEQAAADFARLAQRPKLPVVLLVGEIYARSNAFANDAIIDRLEQSGLKVRLAPCYEWLEYADTLSRLEGRRPGLSAALVSRLQTRIRHLTYAAVAERLAWPKAGEVPDSLAAAQPYLPVELHGEAVLTLGSALHEWQQGQIDAVVNVGPLECMPSKIAEAQFFHASEREGLLSLSLPLNGDPIDPEVIESFAFEVHARWRRKTGGEGSRTRPDGHAASPQPTERPVHSRR